jgi:hypothetical protein
MTMPSTIRAISILMAIVGAASIVFCAVNFLGSVPLSAGSLLLEGDLALSGPVVFLLYAVLMAVLALGLRRRWNWARRGTIVVAIAGVALAVPAISSAVVDGRLLAIAREALQIVVRVIIIYFLMQHDETEWFLANRD